MEYLVLHHIFETHFESVIRLRSKLHFSRLHYVCISHVFAAHGTAKLHLKLFSTDFIILAEAEGLRLSLHRSLLSA